MQISTVNQNQMLVWLKGTENELKTDWFSQANSNLNYSWNEWSDETYSLFRVLIDFGYSYSWPDSLILKSAGCGSSFEPHPALWCTQKMLNSTWVK